MNAWSPAEAERYLRSLEPIGWKLGLERMHLLTTALGMPQHRFASLHVVGTNGKSSVARMVAALLQAHAIRAGACLSPHLLRWSERLLVGGEEIEAVAFAGAVGRAGEAAQVVNRSLDEGEAVTQFELATATAFVALAAAGVQAVAVEAGLGGRLDATNVIPSRVTVLTSIGLDHTEWLGGSELEIAAEKLAVLRDQSTLVVGRVGRDVLRLAEETARSRGAKLVRAPEDPGRDLVLRAPGDFQRRNFALAMTAAKEFLGGLDDQRVREVAEAIVIPGRLELLDGEPPTIIDAAHNPDGAAALAEALPDLSGGRPTTACLAILADKDAPAMIEALAPVLESAVCTELTGAALRGAGRPGSRSWRAEELAALCDSAGVSAQGVTDPEQALAIARERASADGGIALVAGSHYLLAIARARP